MYKQSKEFGIALQASKPTTVAWLKVIVENRDRATLIPVDIGNHSIPAADRLIVRTGIHCQASILNLGCLIYGEDNEFHLTNLSSPIFQRLPTRVNFEDEGRTDTVKEHLERILSSMNITISADEALPYSLVEICKKTRPQTNTSFVYVDAKPYGYTGQIPDYWLDSIKNELEISAKSNLHTIESLNMSLYSKCFRLHEDHVAPWDRFLSSHKEV